MFYGLPLPHRSSSSTALAKSLRDWLRRIFLVREAAAVAVEARRVHFDNQVSQAAAGRAVVLKNAAAAFAPCARDGRRAPHDA